MGQINYTGFIDKYPIELVTLIYSDDEVQAVCVYTNVDTPIELSGKVIRGVLTLYEKDVFGKNSAVFTFQNFNKRASSIEGTWTNLSNNKDLPVKLDNNYTIDYEQSYFMKERKLIQTSSLKDHYFKLVIKKDKNDYGLRVRAVKIIEKKTAK